MTRDEAELRRLVKATRPLHFTPAMKEHYKSIRRFIARDNEKKKL